MVTSNDFCYFFYFFHCCSGTVVPIFTPPWAICPNHPHLPPSILTPLALSMCPLYMFLDNPSPFFPHYLPPLSPVVTVCSVFQKQFVLYFNVSGYILLASLFCWLGSTYRWGNAKWNMPAMMIMFLMCV